MSSPPLVPKLQLGNALVPEAPLRPSASNLCQSGTGPGLRFPAKSHVIIKIKQIRPRPDISPRLRVVADCFHEKTDRLRIAIRPTALLEITPLLNLPSRALVRRVRIDPVENFAVAFSRRQLFAQRPGINPQITEDMLVERAGVPKLTVKSRDFRAPLVEHARKQRVTAQAAPDAARRPF